MSEGTAKWLKVNQDKEFVYAPNNDYGDRGIIDCYLSS